MSEILVLRINGEGGECRFCGAVAKLIVGNDYEVCELPDCMEYAFERKTEEMNYVASRINEIKSQNRYEMALDK